MTPAKTKQHIKAWAATDSGTGAIRTIYGALFIFKRQKDAKEFSWDGDRIVRVEIKVLK